MFKQIWNIFKQIRPTKRFYWVVFLLILFFILAFSVKVLYEPAFVVLWLVVVLCVVDGYLLLKHRQPINAWRVPKHQRLSNGDLNDLSLHVQNQFTFKVFISIIDELPFQFQQRRFNISTELNSEEVKQFQYLILSLLTHDK